MESHDRMLTHKLRIEDEPLLQPSKNKYVLFPVEYDDIWKAYKEARSVDWNAEEINLSEDMHDWNKKLNDNERYFIKNILAFFAGSDGIVMENLAVRFMSDIDKPEVNAFYSFQMLIENVHSETYSLLIDKYVTDPTEKNKLLNAIDTIPAIGNKAQWALRWISNDKASFAVRLIAFAVVEGVFFSGSFCAIYWLKKRGLMPGLTFSNELISRDEGMHTDFAILLYSKINNKVPKDIVYEIFKEAVIIEKKFINDSISCNMIGMNQVLMAEYIEFVADRLLVQLGYERLYNTQNPFDFMELISMRSKTNFFEKRVSEYKRAHIGDSKNEEFAMADDF